MKNYFKFNLTGKKVLPIWIAFIVLFLVPYIFIQVKLQDFKTTSTDPHEAMSRLGSMFKWYGLMLILMLVEYAFLYFIAKLTIEAVEFKEKSLAFIGKFGEFLLVLVPGFLLTILTIGIYGPWYMTKLYNYFAKNTFYDDNSFEFKGKGGDLFLIILFSLVIPMMFMMFVIMIFAIVAGMTGASVGNQPPSEMINLYAGIIMLVVFILLIPYIYYTYKWKINFKIKGYDIQWETSFWSSASKIIVEVLLSIITIGIYSPLAYLKLFKYFGERTIAKSETSIKKFGYDIEPKQDFLFMWGQILLIIITLGIYYPWAFCKISERVFSKSYSEAVE